MASFRHSEITPVMPTRPYTKSGIGGHGNYRKASKAITIPVAPRIAVTQTSGVFLTGIGGAGNVRKSKERALLTPEELLSRSMIQRENAVQNFHHGIGGRGNRASSYSDSLSISFSSSTSSNASVRRHSGADRLREKFGNSKTSLLQAWQNSPADSISLSSSASFSGKS